jgi:hypothetical protein
MMLNAKLRIVITVPVEFKGDSHRSWLVRISRARRSMLASILACDRSLPRMGFTTPLRRIAGA